MEFLATPDIGAASTWTPVTTTNAAPPSATVSTNPNSNNTTTNPSVPHPTPPHPPTPYFPNLDRAGIKNSFQSLFSPNPNAVTTPALLSRTSAPGITPFINAIQTPGLVPPSTAVLSNYPPVRSPHLVPNASPNHDTVLATPYLQAAAKEAVRREFMNMPSYVASNQVPITTGERIVPGNQFASPPSRPPIQVMTKTGSTAPSPVHTSKPLPQIPHPNLANNSSPQTVPHPNRPSTPSQSKPAAKQQTPRQTTQQHIPPQPYFVPHPHPPPGVVMIGQHGMMMPPQPSAMYPPPPPGVMMIPGAQPIVPQPMMMSAPHPIVRQPGPPVKPETPSERKARIEHEKQELIREFKKKTREAALVRFRQKRRERRFGKLIRYDCRKKLADARPRVKGRFVRIKADDDDMSEGPQVVPNMER